MNCTLRFALAFPTLIAAATTVSALEINGHAKIVDGDTIEIGNQVVRFHGIDSPETAQRCRLPNGKTWKCADAAIDRLREHLAEGPVRCTGTVFDDYDRLIAICHSAVNEEINRDLVRKGFAWAFVKYSNDYLADEHSARDAGIGIWRAPSQSPWDFRAERWHVAEQEAPDGCPIKGNISPNGKIYHTPWSQWYSGTKVSIERGERWFCTEREALEAGWRAPLR